MGSYEVFKQNVLTLIGLDLSMYKERQMRRRIESLMTKREVKTYDEYITRMQSDKALFDEFVNYLTINVSEFYRNPLQWDVLKRDILPALIGTGRKNIKVWSAACSTGEEPYSLVMAMSNFLPLSAIKILAVDIDDEAIAKAKIGVYAKNALHALPEEFKTRFFTQIGDAYKINDDVKNCVEFKKMNLLSDSYPSDCDLIVCRNVMIYFTEEAKDEMYHKFSNALVKDGILFVGSTEQIIAPTKYNFVTSKTFFYRKNK